MANSVRSTLYNTNVLPQYVDPFAGVTKYAQQMGDQIRADEKYAAEKARQDKLDARAELQFNQQQAERDAQIAAPKLLTENTVGAHAVTQGDLQDKFVLADIAKAAENKARMQKEIEATPELRAKYAEALKGEDFKQMNAAGELVDMNAADKATLERLTMEQVLGVKGGYKGGDAAKMAYGYKTPAQVQAEQKELAAALTGTGVQEATQTSQGGSGSMGKWVKQPTGQKEVVTPAVAAIPSMTPAAWVNQHPEVANHLVGSSAPYKEGPMSSVRIHAIDALDKKYENAMKPYYQTMNAKASTTDMRNKADSSILKLQAQRDLELKEIMRDKSVPRPMKGVMSKEEWAKATDEKGARTRAVTDAILSMNLSQPKKDAMLRDFGEALTGKAGKGAVTKDIYDERYVPGKVAPSVNNTYQGKVVTTIRGEPIDLTGVPQQRRGVIVEAQRGFRDKVEQMFGLNDILAKSANTMMRDVAAKHNVPLQSLQADKILEQAGFSGKMTPGQERQLKLMEGEMTAAVEQYKMDKDQANADRTFNLQVRKLNQDADQFWAKMRQDENQFSRGLAAKSVEGAGKLPPGWTYDRRVDPKTGQEQMVPVELTTLNEAAKQKIYQNTPEGKAALRNAERKDYDAYKASGVVDWGFDKSVKSYDDWLKDGKPLYTK